MPKAKLTDAVNSGGVADAKENDTTTTAHGGNAGVSSDAGESSGSSESDGADADSSAGDADDSDPADEADDDEPAATDTSATDSAGDDTPKGADRSLEEYRSAFGHVEGSILFADQTPFVDACVAHIGAQAKQIADLTAANAELTQKCKDLASQILGESDPVETGAEGSQSASADSDPVGAFAAGLKIPGEK